MASLILIKTTIIANGRDLMIRLPTVIYSIGRLVLYKTYTNIGIRSYIDVNYIFINAGLGRKKYNNLYELRTFGMGCRF